MDKAAILTNLSACLLALGESDKSLEKADAAIAVRPDYPKVRRPTSSAWRSR
jgi:hypothetical protein